jgi:hypothetical protein
MGDPFERVKGIEPSPPAWKAGALPLSYTRGSCHCKWLVGLVGIPFLSPSPFTLGQMEASKRCGGCGQMLPLARFSYKNRERQTRQSYCKNCANEAWRRWYAKPENKAHHLSVLRKRRKRRIEQNKKLVLEIKSAPCADCGDEFAPEAMDFDHLEDKEALISKLVYTVGTERLLAEIRKCEVVCSNCHRMRTTRPVTDRVGKPSTTS